MEFILNLCIYFITLNFINLRKPFFLICLSFFCCFPISLLLLLKTTSVASSAKSRLLLLLQLQRCQLAYLVGQLVNFHGDVRDGAMSDPNFGFLRWGFAFFFLFPKEEPPLLLPALLLAFFGSASSLAIVASSLGCDFLHLHFSRRIILSNKKLKTKLK